MTILYIMIGPPACGKSTLAGKMAEDDENIVIISSDAVRGELYGDESVQKDHGKVFSICHARMGQALREDKDVIFDATNLVPKNRINLIEIARVNGCEAVMGLVYTGSLESCMERNRNRSRTVPEGIIRNMYDTLKRFPPSFDEGFDLLGRMESTLYFADILEG